MMMELIGIGHEWTGDVDTRPTIDHVIDIEYGGTNEKDNLRVVCYRCNQSKNDRKNEERYENLR
jgi:5-methylcytosine-specific restriction endonuclease McrA